jgi:uncharacterized protein
MPDYHAPGVYVEEAPSAVKPIAGVSTSTAGFIGVFGDKTDKSGAKIMILGNRITEEKAGTGNAAEKKFELKRYPVIDRVDSFEVRVAGTKVTTGISLVNDVEKKVARVEFDETADAPATGKEVTVDYLPLVLAIQGERVVGDWVGTGDNSETEFRLGSYPVVADGDYKVTVAGRKTTATLVNDDNLKVAKVKFQVADIPKANEVVTVDYVPLRYLAPPGEVRLCTSFSDFVRSFGGFSLDRDQRILAHAVSGFFKNGGTRCYVVRVTEPGDIHSLALPNLGVIDEIAIVAAPGITAPDIQLAIENHCRNLGDRFAILDSAECVTDLDPQKLKPAFTSNYAALYFPWLQVFDPVTKTMRRTDDGRMSVPASGHVAGIYARVDAERGVHKAPANEVVMGALDLQYNVTKAQQAGLNPLGVNCIRSINGNIQVWGARTAGGEANADLKYVNVRRTLLFLRKSIERGTQWVVFEPNDPALWQRITRNVTAFLMTVWRSGALFGTTAAEAFYVRCDAETNPSELRELGQVVTEIGVAIVRPAEFVIFRISQFTAAGA